jgi:NAD(P)-dependent dehydrogenase (short-subunit alcohol dehydrogenase family)
MADPRVVLITGASSGVGHSTARLLSQRGFTVFGTSRNPSSADGLSGVEMLGLDVRADDSVLACVEAVMNRSGRLDVLINNAGYELAVHWKNCHPRTPPLSSRPISSGS